MLAAHAVPVLGRKHVFFFLIPAGVHLDEVLPSGVGNDIIKDCFVLTYYLFLNRDFTEYVSLCA